MKSTAIESSPSLVLVDSSWHDAVNQVIEDNLMQLFNELTSAEFHLTTK